VNSPNKKVLRTISDKEVELQKLGESSDEILRKAQLFLDIGDNYWDIGEQDKALDYFRKSLKLCNKINEDIIKVETYQRLGSIKADMFLFPAAIAHFEKAIEISNKIFNDESLGELYRGLGGIYHRIGAVDRAIEYFTKSAEIANKMDDIKTLIKDYNQLGVIYEEKGDFENAFFYYNIAFSRLKKIDDVKIKAKLINNIGMLYYDKGEYKKATKRFEELKKLGEELHNEEMMGRALVNGAHALIKNGEIEKAKEYNKKGDEIFHKIKDRNMLLGVKLNTALIYSTCEKHDSMIKIFDELFNDLKDIYAPYIHGIMHYEFGLCLINIGRREEAKKQLDIAMELFEEVWAINYIKKIKQKMFRL
jgi:tetratricopeptide (TPR) repeat protein